MKCLLLSGLMAGVLGAQVRMVRVDKPQATHPAQWTSIARVRELANGQLLVLDARDQVLKLVDFKTGGAKVVGGKGNGPGEYVLPSNIFALAGDSTLLYDEANSMRPTVFGPTGAYGRTLTLPQGDHPPIVNAFSFIDAQGRYYTGASMYGPEGSAIERWTHDGRGADTVGYFHRTETCTNGTAPSRGQGRGSGARGGGNGESAARGRGPRPFVSIEQWTVAADGRVAIVCPNPYQVRLVSGGRTIAGRPIAYDHVPVREGEKGEWRDAQSAPVAVLRVVDGKMSGGYEKQKAVEPDQWPDALPPFIMPRAFSPVLHFSPDGNLWIARANAAGAGSLYDVVGPDANLRMRVLLPIRSRVVGFGKNAMYVVQRDDDDVEHLQRYAIPR